MSFGRAAISRILISGKKYYPFQHLVYRLGEKVGRGSERQKNINYLLEMRSKRRGWLINFLPLPRLGRVAGKDQER